MTAETTGQDVLDRISEVEGVCLSEALGAADYEAFLGRRAGDCLSGTEATSLKIGRLGTIRVRLNIICAVLLDFVSVFRVMLDYRGQPDYHHTLTGQTWETTHR